MKINETLITDSGTLADFCATLKGTPFITVDTEFMRESTYWPILCLVQVAGPDEAVAIDAMADGLDMTPLFDILRDPDTLKVFHAGRQDMEIFYNLMNHLPAPIFDTQIAAMVCGFGDQVGYETLITKLVGARIDKSSRFTDWSLRPLSDKQIAYALDDVVHLFEAYQKLKQTLKDSGRENWLNEEMEILTATRTYDIAPEDTWKRIKARGAKPKTLAVLRELSIWREKEAQRRDVPRGRVIKDDSLVEIAHHTPQTAKELGRTRGLSKGLADGKVGSALLAAVERGLGTPKDSWPRVPKKPDLPEGIGPMTDLLKVLLKMKCQEMDVAQKLVANVADLDLIAAFGEKADVAALHGWRREVFGNDALRLCNGEIALAARDGAIKIFPTTAPASESA